MPWSYFPDCSQNFRLIANNPPGIAGVKRGRIASSVLFGYSK